MTDRRSPPPRNPAEPLSLSVDYGNFSPGTGRAESVAPQSNPDAPAFLRVPTSPAPITGNAATVCVGCPVCCELAERLSSAGANAQAAAAAHHYERGDANAFMVGWLSGEARNVAARLLAHAGAHREVRP